MSSTQNTAIIRRFFDDMWNANNPDVADEIVHPDYVDNQGVQGPASYKQGIALWHRILTDMRFTVDELVAEGETVIARWTARGTHTGEWPTPIGTIPPSGKSVSTPGTSSFHLRDGKIREDWHHIDFLSMLQQVDATIVPASTMA